MKDLNIRLIDISLFSNIVIDNRRITDFYIRLLSINNRSLLEISKYSIYSMNPNDIDGEKYYILKLFFINILKIKRSYV